MKTTCTFPGCGKVLSCKYRLKTHLERFHLNIRKYECPECFKMFKSRDNLHDHMTKHPQPVELDPNELARYRAHTPILSQPVPIPKLTDLVSMSTDPVLRPFTVIMRIYPYPMEDDKIVIPKIVSSAPDAC
jgi:hypothetical protein